MKTADMDALLRAGGVDPGWYDVSGRAAENRHCILPEGGTWLTFFFERGTRWDVRTFPTEDEACGFFLGWVLDSWRLTGRG